MTAAPKPEPPPDLLELIHSQSQPDLRTAAIDARLNEELALSLLTRRDLHGTVLDDLSRNQNVMKHRKVIVALVSHPRTPRYVSLPITRRLFTFELLKIALQPPVPTDVKMIAEDAIVHRLETISSGERLALARQGTTRIAAALLTDPEERIMLAALDNARLTEPNVVTALMRDEVPEHLVRAAAVHPKWSLRYEVQIAILRNAHTPLARAIQAAGHLSSKTLREVLANSRLEEKVKTYLLEELARRKEAK
jgi:hypothetical protein